MVAALVAVVLSAALHVGLVRLVPPLPVGRPPDVKTFDRLPSIALQDVRRQEQRQIMRPSAFRPAHPEEFVDLSVDAELFESALEAVEPDMPQMDAGPLAGEEGAVAELEPAERAPWEARQDILAVEEELFTEDISLLPRHIVPAVPREAGAGDIALPMDLDTEAATARAGALAAADPLAGTGGAAAWSRARAPAWLEAAPAEGPEAATLAESFALTDEAPEEVTSLEPVETLLELDLQRYQPQDEPGQLYFRIEINRRGAEALPVLPKDIILIQDCSESMTQRKLDDCKRGLHAWLDSLAPEDRCDLMGFREEAYRCFEGWTNLTAATRARANWFIKNMVSRGRTDVYASLKALEEVDREPGRPVIAILVTDGRPTMGLVDSSEIIETFSQENQGQLSIFAFGGGRRVNRFLLDLLSYKNRGDSLVVKERREIPEGLTEWARQLARPVLTDLSYRFAGLNESDIYPRTLTHLYLDRPLVIYGRTQGTLPKVAFQVVGASGRTRHDMVFELPWERAGVGDEALRTEWVWQKIYHLIGEHIRTGQESIMATLRGLEEHYGLVVPYGGDYPVR